MEDNCRSDSDNDVEIGSASHFQEQILFEGISEQEQKFEVNINICGAEDCCAIGSKIALLEIEELGVELSRTLSGSTVKVCRSPCLGLCGKGPAVAISCTNNREAHTMTENFTEVNGPEKCAEVVNAAAKLCGQGPSERTSSSLMQRRADGMRWNALKTFSRHQAQRRAERLRMREGGEEFEVDSAVCFPLASNKIKLGTILDLEDSFRAMEKQPDLAA